MDPLSGGDLFCFGRFLFCSSGLLGLVVFLTLQSVRMTGVCHHVQQSLTLLLNTCISSLNALGRMNRGGKKNKGEVSGIMEKNDIL